MNNELIAELAERAVHQTQLMMIMEYKNFESALYENFAKLIIQECCRICDERVSDLADMRRATYDFTMKSVIAQGENTAELLSADFKKHFGIEDV